MLWKHRVTVRNYLEFEKFDKVYGIVVMLKE